MVAEIAGGAALAVEVAQLLLCGIQILVTEGGEATVGVLGTEHVDEGVHAQVYGATAAPLLAEEVHDLAAALPAGEEGCTAEAEIAGGDVEEVVDDGVVDAHGGVWLLVACRHDDVDEATDGGPLAALVDGDAYGGVAHLHEGFPDDGIALLYAHDL